MDELGWLPFLTAALEIEQRLGVRQAEARRSLRVACGDQRITSMKAPCEEPGRLPFEFWTRIAPGEWREREVDYDGPDADGCEIEIMLKEKDFQFWLDRQSPPLTEPKGKHRTAYRQNLVKRAIGELQLPDNLPTPQLVKRVSDWHKANGQPVPSRTTIIRAVGRRK